MSLYLGDSVNMKSRYSDIIQLLSNEITRIQKVRQLHKSNNVIMMNSVSREYADKHSNVTTKSQNRITKQRETKFQFL